MSNRAKVIAKLKEYIKNLVVKELDEASTTASAGAANPMGTGIYYDTPYAFRSKRKKDKTFKRTTYRFWRQKRKRTINSWFYNF